MTALERALVVYAEAKGYEVERQSRGQIEKWELLEQPIGFNFAFNRYRLRDPRNMHKVCDSLYAEYLSNIPEKSISEMVENLKKSKPAGFSCKTKILTREEIEEMNKPKGLTPELKERYEKVAPFIKILQMWADGNEIESQSKIGSCREWRKLPDNPGWNFNYSNYRIAGKPFTTPATEEEFDVKAYVKSLVEMPEEKERYEEVQPIIEILEAYKRGENNFEIQSKTSTDEGWKPLEDKPSWNFGYVNYRISPKQPEAIPATEEELEYMGLRGKWFWIKDKKTGKMDKSPRLLVDVYDGLFYIFNPVSKTWQDWSSK